MHTKLKKNCNIDALSSNGITVKTSNLKESFNTKFLNMMKVILYKLQIK